MVAESRPPLMATSHPQVSATKKEGHQLAPPILSRPPGPPPQGITLDKQTAQPSTIKWSWQAHCPSLSY